MTGPLGSGSAVRCNRARSGGAVPAHGPGAQGSGDRIDVDLDPDPVGGTEQVGGEHGGGRPDRPDPTLVEQHDLVGDGGGMVEGRLCASRATRRAKSRLLSAHTSEPSGNRTCPDEGLLCNRASARSSVDLPLPFGPTRAVTRPARSSTVALCTTVCPE